KRNIFMSKVLIISSSLRAKSNSDLIAKQIQIGALDKGHDVELLSLKGKKINYCIGCFSCASTGKCVFKDDVADILAKVKEAESIVFVSPIYYYEMSGQMKTLIDRMNPLYGGNNAFKHIYFASTATDDEPSTPERAIFGLKGFVACFDGVKFEDSLFLGGNTDPEEIGNKPEQLKEAYEFGKKII
ncbi:MAG: flavodoxin family protein, partial [Bacilli bacterium]|nr:flavodoxin family protein [Bacilli bacterium]